MDEDSCLMKYIEIVALGTFGECSNVTDIKQEPFSVKIEKDDVVEDSNAADDPERCDNVCNSVSMIQQIVTEQSQESVDQLHQMAVPCLWFSSCGDEMISTEDDCGQQTDKMDVHGQLNSKSSSLKTYNKSYECDICRRTYTRRSDVIRHKQVHSGVKPYVCVFCNKTFGYRWHLKDHIRIHTGDKPYSCDICSKSFSLSRSLKEHKCIYSVRTQVPSKFRSLNKYRCIKPKVAKSNYNADTWDGTNSNSGSFRAHAADKPYECDICHRTYTRSSDVTRHRKIHSGVKPYVCMFCNTAFSYPWRLNQHLRIHTGGKPYSCDICSKSFSLSRSLKEHKLILHAVGTPYLRKKALSRFRSFNKFRRTKPKVAISNYDNDTQDHTNSNSNNFKTQTAKKSYQCDVCHRTYTRSSDVTRHKQIHSGVKPYVCMLCNKAFSYSWRLNEHLRIHTGDTPYSCDICNKTFSLSGSLKKHKRIHIGDVPYM